MKSTSKQIASLFVKLGFIAFGGPAAHIAMMRDETVRRKKWLDDNEFLDLVGATNLIPGPNSTEMAIHLGYKKGGWKGLVIAGLCFIIPAVFITLGFAWLYKKYGQLPEIQPFIYGIKPAIIAIILAAVFPFAQKAVKNIELAVFGILALAFSLFGFGEVYILFIGGFLYMVWRRAKSSGSKQQMLFPLLFLSPKTAVVSVSNAKLFLIFLKVGAILYGSGYVLFAFLDSELVATGILPRQTLIDAIAVGQITPGPVFSSVTFIGYQINGFSGAFISTLGIFLPSFVFVALLPILLKKMRDSKNLSAFLDAVNVISVAFIIAVCFEMGKETLLDWRTIFIALLSLALMFGFKRINSVWIVFGSSILGFLLFHIS